MADHSVGARDESNGSEASEALKMLPQKTLALSSICSRALIRRAVKRAGPSKKV